MIDEKELGERAMLRVRDILDTVARQRGEWSMRDIRAMNKAVGQFWFEPDTLRFFRSRVSDYAYNGPGGVFFVSSECGPNQIRAYTVRRFDPATGSIKDGSEFQAYATSATAHRWARKMAAGEARLGRMKEHQR